MLRINITPRRLSRPCKFSGAAVVVEIVFAQLTPYPLAKKNLWTQRCSLRVFAE